MESPPPTDGGREAEQTGRERAAPAAEGFTFAFVRNPFERLVSAYTKHIVTTDKSTSIHRAWIRELHGLGDSDKISFSHFVRWIAQQESSLLHRSWQPYSDTCQFGARRYDFVGRLESLERDMRFVMEALKLEEADRRLWEQVSAKSRPMQPIGGEDRILQLHHFYQSDDAHDLVEIVRRRYEEDLALFNYTFPVYRPLGVATAWKGGGPTFSS